MGHATDDPQPGSSITIVKEYWPGYVLGPLMITRAGCAVAGGGLDKEIAEHSLDGAYHYNVDGSGERSEDGLTDDEWLELLRFRCFVTCAKPHADRFPYDDTWVER